MCNDLIINAPVLSCCGQPSGECFCDEEDGYEVGPIDHVANSSPYLRKHVENLEGRSNEVAEEASLNRIRRILGEEKTEEFPDTDEEAVVYDPREGASPELVKMLSRRSG